MSEKSFTEPTARSVVKNPLLSTAVTGLSLEDLTHNAVLLPVRSQESVLSQDSINTGPQTSTLRRTPLKSDSQSNIASSNIIIPSNVNPNRIVESTSDCATEKTLAKTQSIKPDDDFDVNEYFARLQGTRYVSAPFNSHLKEDQNPNLESTEENLEEINLNDSQSSEDLQHSITSDIAQNFSQLPQVLPQVASAVFSSFSNMLSLKSREHPVEYDSRRLEFAGHQEPRKDPSYQEVNFEMPPRDQISSITSDFNEAKPIGTPPCSAPPAGSTSNTFRITTKRKVYAQIPGLCSGYKISGETSLQNPFPPSSNFDVSQTFTSMGPLTTQHSLITADVATSNVNFYENTPLPEILPGNRESDKLLDKMETQSDSDAKCDENTKTVKVAADNIKESRAPFQYSSVSKNPDNEIKIYQPCSQDRSAIQSNIPVSIETQYPMFNVDKQTIPPPPVFSATPRQDNQSFGVNKTILPPSVARRIGSSHPVIKTMTKTPDVDANIFVPKLTEFDEQPKTVPDFHNTASANNVIKSNIQNQKHIGVELQNSLNPTVSVSKEITSLHDQVPTFTSQPRISQNPRQHNAGIEPPNLTTIKQNENIISQENVSMYSPQSNIFLYNPTVLTPKENTIPQENLPMLTQQSTVFLNPNQENESYNFINSMGVKQSTVQQESVLNTPESNFVPSVNITQSQGEKTMPLPEPPKLPPGALSFRMTKKRPQYYSGPVTNFGSLGNNIIPSIPLTSFESPAYQGTLFTPETAPLSSVFQDHEQPESFNVTSSMPQVFPTSSSIASVDHQTFQRNQFDLTTPLVQESTADSYQRSDFNTAFDLSRPTTEDYELLKPESKGFGIIGSLKSKLSAIDMNKIQDSVTNFFDPNYKETKKEISTTSHRDPNTYGNSSTNHQNIDIFVPFVDQKQDQHDYYNQEAFQSFPNVNAYDHQDKYDFYSNKYQNRYVPNLSSYSQQIHNSQEYSGAPYLQQGFERRSDKYDFPTCDVNYSQHTKTDQMYVIPQNAAFLQTTDGSVMELSGNTYPLEIATEALDTYLPFVSGTEQKVENLITGSNTQPFSTANKQGMAHSWMNPADTEMQMSFKQLDITNIPSSETGTKVLLMKIDKNVTEDSSKNVHSVQSGSEPVISQVATDEKPIEIPASSEPIIEKNNKIIRDAGVISSSALFSNDMLQDYKIQQSTPLFDSYAEKNSTLNVFSSSIVDSVSVKKMSNDCTICDNVEKENENILATIPTAVSTPEKMTSQARKSSVTDLSICETCREVNAQDEKEAEGLTTQLIENITGPMQLFNPVEIPLTENTKLDTYDRENFDIDQCVQISHITEETYDTLQVQSATEFFDKEDIDNFEKNSNINPEGFVQDYGWRTDIGEVKTDSVLIDHDYNFETDPSAMGFYSGNSLFFDDMNLFTNASDEFKAGFRNAQEETGPIPSRQISIPTAPPAEDLEEDSKSDGTGVIDVQLIEQDAKKDFPVFEEFVIEPSETDDDKIEFREREKSSDDSPHLDSFTDRVEKYKQLEDNTDFYDETIANDQAVEGDITNVAITLASYFDTGNYAADTYYKNLFVTSQGSDTMIAPTYEPMLLTLIANSEATVEALKLENVETEPIGIQDCNLRNVDSFEHSPKQDNLFSMDAMYNELSNIQDATDLTKKEVSQINTHIIKKKNDILPKEPILIETSPPLQRMTSEHLLKTFTIDSEDKEILRTDNIDTGGLYTETQSKIKQKNAAGNIEISENIDDFVKPFKMEKVDTESLNTEIAAKLIETKSVLLRDMQTVDEKRETMTGTTTFSQITAPMNFISKPFPAGSTEKNLFNSREFSESPKTTSVPVVKNKQKINDCKRNNEPSATSSIFFNKETHGGANVLQDPISFFNTECVFSEPEQKDNESEGFSRLASYFSSPTKTDNSKSFFESSQNHFRHPHIKDETDLVNNDPKASNTKSFFELRQSENHYKKDERYLANLELMKHLTSYDNLDRSFNNDDVVKTVNYFRVQLDDSPKNVNKSIGDICETPLKAIDNSSLIRDNPETVTEEEQILDLVECEHCYDDTVNFNDFSPNSDCKLKKSMNTEEKKSNMKDIENHLGAKDSAPRKNASVSFGGTYAEDDDENMELPQDNRSSTECSTLIHHWYYRVDAEGKSVWKCFSSTDSEALENAFNSPDLNEDTLVPTDGGRFDVNIVNRTRSAVFWDEKPNNVRRCSWFYKGTTDAKYVPYPEPIAEKLENEYRHGVRTGEWHRRMSLPNGEAVVMHGPAVIVHFLQSGDTDAWGSTAQSTVRPRVVRRGHNRSEIEPGEPAQVDHLLLMCHGVGSTCDIRFRPIVEVVDDFRSTSLQLIQSHYRNNYETGAVGRVEVLPISWHNTLHDGEAGVDRRLAEITLDSIPRLRSFTNDTVLDVLFYTSPVYSQVIIDTVCKELNRIYDLFKRRNPNFTGTVSLGGHSLGSVILYDLLCHQNPKMNENGPTQNTDLPPAMAMKRYLRLAGTGQPSMKYPVLDFNPDALYALGSPIAIFECIRGVESLGEDFHLPTCAKFFNIFHPYDPIAYRIEPLINSKYKNVPPYLIPHHKGRKRMHLELKETMARVGADLRQKVIDSIKTTWTHLWRAQPPGRELERVVEEELEKEHLTSEKDGHHTTVHIDPATPVEPVGRLNGGRRVDRVLQEAPLELINEYLFAMSSHVRYWESEDTMLLILREIYDGLGVSPDGQVPPPTMTVQRDKQISTADHLDYMTQDERPSTSAGLS